MSEEFMKCDICYLVDRCFVQLDRDEYYKMYTSHNIAHSLAYDLTSYGIYDGGQIETPQLSIIIGRPLTTLEQWINENVEQFK